MKKYNFREAPFRLDGVPFFYERGELRRYNDEIITKYPRLETFDKKLTGARLRFAIKGRTLKIRVFTDNFYHDRGMSLYQVNCAYVFTGDYSRSKYTALLQGEDFPDSAGSVVGEIPLPDEKTEITVWMPRNPHTTDIIIETDDDAELFAPADYSAEKPFVFYGSSITECGITSVPCAYASLLSRWFDSDFYNFGASGNAQGEPEMADWVSKIDMSVFIMDYDHNAPSADWLRNTHRPFYERFRQVRPDTPVIMMSRPSDDTPEFEERRQIVRDTYDFAVVNGDKNVYYIDGKSYFEGYDREMCTIDITHPNDLGHYLMAKKISGTIEKITGRQPVEF